MESKSLINCHWLNKLDSVVGSRLDVDNSVIMPPPARVHPYSRTVGGVGGVDGTFSDTVWLGLKTGSARLGKFVITDNINCL